MSDIYSEGFLESDTELHPLFYMQRFSVIYQCNNKVQFSKKKKSTRPKMILLRELKKMQFILMEKHHSEVKQRLKIEFMVECLPNN